MAITNSNSNACFLVLVVLGVALASTSSGKACTTVLVGRALTADGSVIHAHNEDMGNEAVGRLWSAEASLHAGGQPLSVPYVSLEQVQRTLGYWAGGNALGAEGLGASAEYRAYDSVLVGLNENGVSLSCNWAHSREGNRQGVGLRRYAIRQLLLERATSARHGVDLLGAWIETYGQADWGGLVYNLADTREAWVVETTTRNWVARRVRDDEIRVVANRFRIGSDYDLSSKTLVSDAAANGWIDPTDGKLDFAQVYGLPSKMNQAYDTAREERVQDLLQPREGAIAPEDLFGVLRDRYEGTDYYTPPQQQPVWREDLDAAPDLSRTIGTNLAQSTFVAHLRANLPVSIGAVMWFGLGTPSYAGYVPLYAGGGSVPEEFSSSELEETDASTWWLFRRLQRAADRDYESRYPAIREFWTHAYETVLDRQREIEANAVSLLEAGKPMAAMEALGNLTYSHAAKTLGSARELLQATGLAGDSKVEAPSGSANEQIQNRGEGKDQWWNILPRAAWSEFERVGQSQNWFEVYEIRPGVLAIYEPGQFEEIISYLIIGSERALLFDTGLGIGDMRRLINELTDKEIVVLNSHTHYDHVGGNHAFETIYGTNLEYTREHERGRNHEEVAEFVGPGWIWKDTPAGFSVNEYVSRPFSISHRIGNGQVLSLGDIELEILLTPGHAPDSLCLLDRARRLLFTGDTFYPATLYAHLPGSAFRDYEATAKALAELSDTVDIVLPAHNEPTMTADELALFGSAFQTMQKPDTPFVLTDGNREYDFGRFSILVGDPPPWQ
jgi:dipeptidase/glyoxylase-like metal-dependent hydrolase (beta-lactamase superfamily II)